MRSSARGALFQSALVATLISASLVPAAGAHQTDGGPRPEPTNERARTRPGELIVAFRSPLAARSFLGRRLADSVRPIGPSVRLVKLRRNVTLRDATADLEARPGVDYVEPNHIYTAASDDPWFPYQWGLQNTGQDVRGRVGISDADIDAPEAWAIATGTGVSVAVLDTGVALSHEDLQSGLVAGYDFVGGDSDPNDPHGHGTHVAGIVGARKGNSAGGIGTAPGATMIPVRVLDEQGKGTTSTIAQGINYAVARGARVVNMSLGGDGFSRTLYDAISAAPDVLFVAAAGNGGDDKVGDDTDSANQFPCSYDLANVLCVTASEQSDALPSFANYGAQTVDLAAPGYNILSTVPSGYSYASGTSMATPFVAGIAALVLEAAPGISAAQLRTAIMDGADPVAALSGKVLAGRANALGALLAAGLSPVDLPTETPSPTPEPTESPSATPTPTPTPVNSQSPTPTPTPTPTPKPSTSPSPTPTPTPSASPSPKPTVTPKPTPTPSPTPTAGPAPWERNVKLRISRRRVARGKVWSFENGAGSCLRDVPVYLTRYRKDKAVDAVIVKTKDDGRFKKSVPSRKGWYIAEAPMVQRGDDICAFARSSAERAERERSEQRSGR